MNQEADLIAKWEATSWAKKKAKKAKRASMTDFDRFKVDSRFVDATVLHEGLDKVVPKLLLLKISRLILEIHLWLLSNHWVLLRLLLGFGLSP